MTGASETFALLGLTPQATLDEVRAARRRLALELHPDRGGDQLRMQQINAAFDAAVGHLTGRRPLEAVVDTPTPNPRAGKGSNAGPTGRGRTTGPTDPVRRVPPTVQHDMPSFVVEALPAVAFEALLVVTSWIGEVLVEDPPYLLEVHLYEPSPCWCRLDLVPDAGASTVSLTVAPAGGIPPSVEAVRDLWVANLNRI